MGTKYKIMNYEELVKIAHHARDNNQPTISDEEVHTIDPAVTNLIWHTRQIGETDWVLARFFTAHEDDSTPVEHSVAIHKETYASLREWEKPEANGGA